MEDKRTQETTPEIVEVQDLTGGDLDQVSGGFKASAKIGGSNTTLSSNNQMAMIQLQSVVSQRQNAIQLTTNLINSMNDGTKSVIDNIK